MSRTTAATMLLYGATDATKTSQAEHVARYVWKHSHKRTIFLTCDGGGVGTVQSVADSGLMLAYNIPLLADGNLFCLRKLSQGYIPEIKGNKLTLTPPTADRWEEFGCLFVEGVTSWGDRIMRDLRMKNRKVGQEANFSFTIAGTEFGSSESEVFAGASPAFYGFIQSELQVLIENTRSLPIEKVVWTALESKGEDRVTKEPMYGPDIAGSKAVSKCPAWFGDALHLDVFHAERKDPQGKVMVDSLTGAKLVEKKVRAYFQDHPDPRTGIRWPAKARVSPTDAGKLLQKWPGGFFDVTYADGIEPFLAMQDTLLEEAAVKAKSFGYDHAAFQAEMATKRAAAPQTGPQPVPAAVPAAKK